MYRVNTGTNTAIHCFLCSLEAVYLREGALPQTLYHQIDGGSENTSHAMMGICELLVSKRLCTKLVLSRLLVGHTHEGMNVCRNNNIMTSFLFRYRCFIWEGLAQDAWKIRANTPGVCQSNIEYIYQNQDSGESGRCFCNPRLQKLYGRSR